MAKSSFDCTLEMAAKMLMEAARFLDGCGSICEDEEPGSGDYFYIKAGVARMMADEIFPACEDWGGDNILRFPHERVRRA